MPNTYSCAFLSRFSVLAAIAVSLAAGSLSAQSLSFGELQGVALDSRRQPLANVEVRVQDRSGGAVRWTTTQRDGSYRLRLLPAGRYNLTVEALGYRPVVHLDVAVAVGHTQHVETVLRESPFPVTQVDTVQRRAMASESFSWLVDRGYADLPGTRRVGSDATAFGTNADEFSVEGLPWRLTESMVDGSRSAWIGSPRGYGSDGAGLAFPVRGASQLRVGGLGFDIEAGGSGVGLATTTHRGGRDPLARATIEGGAGNYGASFIFGGPIQGDTAQAIFGIDYQKTEVERPSLLGEDAARAAAIANAAASSYTTDISAYTLPSSRLEQRTSGFGRLDWQPGERIAISMRASGSRFTSSDLPDSYGLPAAYGTHYEAISAQASLNLYAQLSRRVAHELRISADVGEAESRSPTLPFTSFSESGLSLGGLSAQPYTDARTTPRVSGLLHFDLGVHRIKAGFSMAGHRFDSRFVNGASGEYVYGGIADFSAGDGAWRRVVSSVPSGEFRMTETSFFIQDAWRLADGLSVTLGARLDDMRIPVGRIEPNADWLAASGLDNRAVDSKTSRISPRIGFRWELGHNRDWVLEGGAGVFQDLPDRRDIAEVLTFDRSTPVRYGVGPIASWPTDPDLLFSPVVGNTVSLLAPDFEGPRTQRISMGLTRLVSDWSMSVNGVYRHTDFIGRRRDINLPTAPLGFDQYGRELYGGLTQVGGVIAATPYTNRRFTDFDAVHVVEATGYSDYYGATVGLERVREVGLSMGASYTLSRTNDNVPNFASNRVSPFPNGLGGNDWGDGRSDLDVPHRVLLAADWAAGQSGAIRFGFVYNLASGLPFTPGFAPGVDANGDGDWHNDPAQVDPALPGMAGLLNDWACLRKNSGVIVERNSCRGDLQHRLDLRFSVRLAQLAMGKMELMVDALDVIAVDRGPVDRALLTVDRTGSITTDPVTGALVVPYAANPNFGKLLIDRTPGIFWRVGLRIVP